MLSVADSAFYLLILQLRLHAVLLGLLLFTIFLPCYRGSEYNVLSYARGVERRTGRMSESIVKALYS